MADDVELRFGSPNRRKTYVDDEVAGIRVPCTEVRLDDSPGPQGSLSNEPFRLYDTSGPGSDPEVGLPALREEWILDRGDVQRYDGRPVERRDDGRVAARRVESAGLGSGSDDSGAAQGPGRDRRPLRAIRIIGAEP
jgi:phosphomethylpyrimidine synthase